jgi:signal transduction histidine kinase
VPEPVDAALYYDAAEALANAAKDAGAGRITLTVARDDGTVVLSVSDDGVGGADVGRGSGLRGLADRVEALDGRFNVSSPAGAGITLRAEIPCGS